MEVLCPGSNFLWLKSIYAPKYGLKTVLLQVIIRGEYLWPFCKVPKGMPAKSLFYQEDFGRPARYSVNDIKSSV